MEALSIIYVTLGILIIGLYALVLFHKHGILMGEEKWEKKKNRKK